MKTLIGLESKEGLEASLAMLKALSPGNLQAEVLHVVDISKAYPGYGLFPSPDLPGQMVDVLEKESKELAGWAQAFVEDQKISCSSQVKWGAAGQKLLEEATATSADLIALHRGNASGLERLLLGSVSKSVLLGAQQSVLVTKGEPYTSGDFTAVIGVDHSPYCMKCIELLLNLHLTGIKKLMIVTALEGTPRPPDGVDYRTRLMEKNEELCLRFSSVGIETAYEIVEAPAVKALHEAMDSANANLMIVGAHGHGFIERLLLGSTSLHQVAAEPYSVLVLRV